MEKILKRTWLYLRERVKREYVDAESMNEVSTMKHAGEILARIENSNYEFNLAPIQLGADIIDMLDFLEQFEEL